MGDFDSAFDEIVKALNDSFDGKTGAVSQREGEHIEYKESFNWGGRSEYAKSMAGFANHSGGFLVFGIKNDPREVIGLRSNNFESQDDSKVAGYLNGLFAPALQFERRVGKIAGIKERRLLCKSDKRMWRSALLYTKHR